jgi:hypothetical protein
MSRVQSSIGAAQNYGPRTTNEGLDSTVHKSGIKREVELFLDYTQANAGLPTSNANVDSAVLTIPANSFITAAYFDVGTAFTSAGSATLQLGVETTAGATVDADGIDTIAVAALTVNSWTVCDGALVGATVGTAAVQISVDDATAVFTAGTGRLVVEYIETQV